MLGEHTQWQKQLLFEESVRVPLIIAVPGRKGSGGVAPKPVELLDVYPTLAELCGLKPVHELEGKSLAPLLDEPSTEWNRPAFSQVTRRRDQRLLMGYSVRTDRWRYTQWGRNGADGQELYDHMKDDKELTNLADDPAHAGTVAEMAKLIEPHRAKYLARRAAQAASAPATQP